MAPADEQTPLIAVPTPSEPTAKPDKDYKHVLLLLCTVLVLIQCGDQLAQSPNTRIAEAIFCYHHYESSDPTKLLTDRAAAGPGAVNGVLEGLCKVEAVQSRLSSLRGYQGFLDGMPCLILALPFGWAADRYGRKPFLFLGALSFVLRAAIIQAVFWFWQTFDIRWTWASSLHGLMAGSSPVVSALFFVIIADVVPETDRSKIFLRVGGANLIASVCMPLLSAWLMEYTPWIPALAGTALQTSAVFVVLALPETLNWRAATTPTSTEEPPNPKDPQPTPLARLRAATTFLTTDWRVPSLTASFLLHLAIADSGALQLQYVSTRYALSYASATTLLTLRAVANMALLLILLPSASTYLVQTHKLSTLRSDLYLSRASMAFWALGWTIFGLAPGVLAASAGMGVSALGWGSMFLMRSFMTPLVPEGSVARLYSLISVVDTVGGMLGAPLLAGLFNRGLRVGGLAVGLPWYFLGAGCAVVAVLLCVVGVRKGEEGEDEDEEEGGGDALVGA